MTEQHTPTPWVYEDESVNNPSNGGLIADCFDNNGSAEENAKHIVHCVNSNDEYEQALVAIAKECLRKDSSMSVIATWADRALRNHNVIHKVTGDK